MKIENLSTSTSRSVVRALSILNMIGGESKGISEISKQLNLSKGTVFSLMKTLEAMDYVAQNKNNEKYRLGPAVMKLASKKISKMDIVEVSRPHLQALSDKCGEVTNLTVREGFHALFLMRAESRKVSRILHLNSQVGMHSPLHCTSSGKIFLASMTQPEFEQFLQIGLTQYTGKTITGKEQLKAEILKVRQQDYALNLGEYEEGLYSVAVAVKDRKNGVVAAINVAVPSVRMPDEKIPYFYENLKEVSSAISKELFE